MGDQFGELLNLSKFVRFVLSRMPMIIGDTEHAEPWCIGGDHVVPLFIV